MSGYVANNRNDRPPTATPPYDGRLDKQPPRTMEGSGQKPPSCLVSIRYIWNNGECLSSGTPYTLALDTGVHLQEGLDEQGTLQKSVQANSYQAGLLVDSDTDALVSKARAELQTVLDEILAEERAEAARLQAEQDARNPLTNTFYRSVAFGKGFYFGAWRLLKTGKEYANLVDPHTHMWNALASAWNAKVSGKQRWVDSFLSNFSAEQHRELVEALGFDPTSITREQIAEAYELACFLAEDGPSQKTLGSFAVDYAQAQNIEEVSEFTGAATFEIVLTALLVVFTGGVGLAASARHLDKLKRLGGALRKLSGALKSTKIKIASKVTGRGTAAKMVEVPKPKAIGPESIATPKEQISGAAEKQGSKKSRNKPPEPLPEAEGRPHSIIEKPGKDGQYTTHNGDGTWKQYRGSGQEHGGIPRPNVKEAGKNVTPDGREIIDKGRVRPPSADEIPRK